MQARKRRVYPFTAIVGQEEMKLALLLNVIDPRIGGVMIMGDRGTGKSTTAVHIGVALALAGKQTALIDLDSRQRTSTRYLENRWNHAQRHGITLPGPAAVVVADGDGAEAELRFEAEPDVGEHQGDRDAQGQQT